MEEHGNDHDPTTLVVQLRALTSETGWDAAGGVARRAADMIERLADDDVEAAILLGRQSALLHAVADALHGGPLAGGLWSWHDRAERAATAVGELEQLRAERERVHVETNVLLAAKDAEIAAVRAELEAQRSLAESACSAHDAVASELFFAAQQSDERR